MSGHRGAVTLRPQRTDAPTLDLRTTLLVRVLPSGDHFVAPVCDLSLASVGTESHCLSEQRLFLGEHLARISPESVAGFALPDGVRLETVDVVVPRDALPRRNQVRTPIAVTSVVIPTPEGDAWIVAVPLDHVFYVPRAEVTGPAIAAEVLRLVGARQMDPWEYLRLLPARAHTLVPMDLQIARPERLPPGRAASLCKALVERQRTTRAAEVLASVATALHTVPGGPCRAIPPLPVASRQGVPALRRPPGAP